MPEPLALTIVGLGPGDASLLTVEARDTIAAAQEVWLRTARHPTVAALPDGPRYQSFDAIYDNEASFDAVYARIVDEVLALAARPGGVVYAVPGHPLFGEATVRELLHRAADAGITTRVVAGISFLDVAAPLLDLDPLADGMMLLDGLALHAHSRQLVPQRPALIAQVYDRRAASTVKLALLEAYPPDHAVRVVRGAGRADATVTDRALAQLDHDDAFDHLTCLYVPPLVILEDVRTFEGLRAVVAKLRDPDGGCPWDLEQTHESLKRYLLEEAYEALEALDTGDPAKLVEELGDLMMQVLLHAQLGEDAGEFVIEDVIASITTKLVRRHPHVFGDREVAGAEEVLRNWDVLKKEERGDAPLLDAVPRALPALAQAQSVQSRAQSAGLAQSPAESSAGVTAAATDARSLGALLFEIVAHARAIGVDAEESLRLEIQRFRKDVQQREASSVRPSTDKPID